MVGALGESAEMREKTVATRLPSQMKASRTMSNDLLTLARLLARGRISIALGRQGVPISAENVLATITAVLAIALLF
jgi:hypothetical protein